MHKRPATVTLLTPATVTSHKTCNLRTSSTFKKVVDVLKLQGFKKVGKSLLQGFKKVVKSLLQGFKKVVKSLLQGFKKVVKSLLQVFVWMYSSCRSLSTKEPRIVGLF